MRLELIALSLILTHCAQYRDVTAPVIPPCPVEAPAIAVEIFNPSREACTALRVWDSSTTEIVLGFSEWTVYTFKADGITRITPHGGREIVIDEEVNAGSCTLDIEDGKLVEIREKRR